MKNGTIFILLLALTVFIPSGNSDAKQKVIKIDELAAAGYVAFIANSVPSEQDAETTGANPDVKKCACKGTGKIKQVDGNVIDCPYHGDNGSLPPEPQDSPSEQLEERCQCDNVANGTTCNCVAVNGKCYCEKFAYKKKAKSAPASPSLPVKSSKQILYFTATWCGPCLQFKDNDVPLLKDAGYTVSPDEQADIRVIDVDSNPELYVKYGRGRGIPLFVLLKGEAEKEAIIGRQNVSQGGDRPDLRPADQVSNMWNKN